MGSNGIMDFFWMPKLSPAGMAEVKSINAAVSLLVTEVGDNLPGNDSETNSFLRHYTSKQTLTTTVYVSNFGGSDITGATLRWRVLGMTAAGANMTVCQGSSLAAPALPQGPTPTKAGSISCKLPDLGTFAKDPQPPVTLTLEVELHAAAAAAAAARGAAAALSSNSWRSRVYAAYEDGPSPKGVNIYTESAWCNLLPYNNLHCGDLPSADTAVPPGSIFVVDHLDAAVRCTRVHARMHLPSMIALRAYAMACRRKLLKTPALSLVLC